MDFFIKNRHLAVLPRQFPSRFNIHGIGYFRSKTEWVRRAFPSFNYSFILKGGGEYYFRGKRWEVVAPCVITQWPEEKVEYGPALGWKSWEELYLIYPQSLTQLLSEVGLASMDRPIWRISNMQQIQFYIEQLKELLSDRELPRLGTMDRIDRCCEQLVMESLFSAERGEESEEKKAIRSIRKILEGSLSQSIDFEEIAKEHGFSQATFRRCWAREMDEPPARYVMKLRIQEACRLLVETRLSIGEVSHRLGFEDPLYFSRKFKKEMKMTASAYRKWHQRLG